MSDNFFERATEWLVRYEQLHNVPSDELVGYISAIEDTGFGYKLSYYTTDGCPRTLVVSYEKMASKDGPEDDPTNPDYYRMGNAEAIDISEHLTFSGGNAVKYIVRSCRVDGVHKSDRLEDLAKAKWYIEREIDRLSKTE